MFDLNAVFAASNKHWKLCLYYLLLGYSVRIVQGLTLAETHTIALDYAIAMTIIIPGALTAGSFTKIDDGLEYRFYQIAICLAMLIGLFSGRLARFILAGY